MTANWSFIAEPDLVPYQATRELPAAGLLVLAPHPDDETFGCGGTVALACDAGRPVTIAVATDGGQGGDAQVREAECRQAVAELGGKVRTPELHFWRHPDRGLRPDGSLIAAIRSLATRQAPGWLLAPSPFEVHPDHRALCVAAIEAAAGLPVALGFYEIGQPLLAQRFVDITAVMARKRAAMSRYVSQIAQQRYDEQVEALNRLRAYTLGPSVRHAEAFWFPAAARAGGVAAVLDEATRHLAVRLGLLPPP